MVKSNHPLQIRLTEPVVFLRGPSTGLDFRGRPQVIREAQPAMLRGLLTLRLTKPTRIRKIEVKLEGKSRTEWPEGIGARRMETSEEHVVISETTTYFSALEHSHSRAPATRRAASLGPGTSAAQWDLDYERGDDDTPGIDIAGQDDHGESHWAAAHRQRQITDSIPRSVSALAGTHDSHTWHREGFSRRPSFDETEVLFGEMGSEDRGPTPAYTAQPQPEENPSRPCLHQPEPPTSSREPLSPIVSAPTSGTASERGDRTSTERRQVAPSQMPRGSQTPGIVEEDGEPSSVAMDSATHDLPPRPTRPSILEVRGPRHSSGEVRFADNVRQVPRPDADESYSTSTTVVTSGLDCPSNRTASIRTMNSAHSDSTTSLNAFPPGHQPGGELHPVASAIQTISAISTAHNSPRSATPSIHPEDSPTDEARRSSLSSASQSQGEQDCLPSTNDSRHSSHLSRETRSNTPSGSTNPRAVSVDTGRSDHTSRHGSMDNTLANTVANSATTIATRPHDRRLDSGESWRSAGTFPRTPRTAKPPVQGPTSATRDPSEDGRGRRHSKFSLAAALEAVKDRVGSKSRSRNSRSRPSSNHDGATPTGNGSFDHGTNMSRTGSGNGPQGVDSVSGTLAHVGHLLETERGRDGRAGPSQVDFTHPFGRGGAARQSRSRDRTVSPSRKIRDGDHSPNRNRGRHKGMKVLTGKLGLDHEVEGEDVHNWKEFRKGTYNYPISFPIPLDAPPTLHAEFGSVVYRLKASVIRAGALTTNLVEELEVVMIASPQEDDLEETENVIVERQWEDQMRYQITLNGKAFPIGGMIPLSVRLMPLMKCKIHRLSVTLEEKTDYYAQERKVARHETPKKFLLLFLKQPERFERLYPLLPIISDDPNAAKESPLAQLAAQAAVNNPSPDAFDPEDEDSVYATLLDSLGPWHLEKNLQIPDCASGIKFTTKHDKTNVTVGHWLKVTIRVERGDDVAVDSKGRRKQFDIIIETPIKILDCRVNPQWNSLPTYTPFNPGSRGAMKGICSIHGTGPKHSAPLTASRTTQDPLVAVALSALNGPTPESIVDPNTSRNLERREMRDTHGHGHGHGHAHGRENEDTLLERNIVYDRLMSGQETETGEVPPSYKEAVGTVREQSVVSGDRSISGDGASMGLDCEGMSRSRLRLRDST